jgi:CMP/dCMP kinase
MMSDKTKKPTKLITIDGPSGVGKTTIGMKLAEHLGWGFLDSGILYRLFALKSLNIDKSISLNKLIKLDMQIDLKGYPEKIYLDGENVAAKLSSEQCSQEASRLAVNPDVRTALLQMQRDFYKVDHGLVAIGRDMGSVVFKNEASLKLYLDASVAERSKRRYNQLQQVDKHVSFVEVNRDLECRDNRDKSRRESPLKIDDSYVVIDSTDLSIDEIMRTILKIWDSLDKP